MERKEEVTTKCPSAKKPVPVAIQRLLDEVRNPGTPSDYNRRHNRHNRS
jgi:hypothetical protein